MRRIGENDALQHSLALSRMVEKASLQLTTLTAPHVFSLDDIINEKPSDEVCGRGSLHEPLNPEARATLTPWPTDGNLVLIDPGHDPGGAGRNGQHS